MTHRLVPLALLLTLAFVGCRKEAHVYVWTQPVGALVRHVDGGTSEMSGPPLAWNYTLPKEKGPCWIIRGFVVEWASGARASMDRVQVCGKNNQDFHLTFPRPEGYPNLNTDLEIALQVEQMLYQNAALRDARRQSLIQAIYGARSSRRVNCTSTQVGSQIYTTCR